MIARWLPVRNIVFGLVAAAVLSLGGAKLLASGPCPVSTECRFGTELYGYSIECDCPEVGSCELIESGYEIQCACDPWEAFRCDCDNGCPF